MNTITDRINARVERNQENAKGLKKFAALVKRVRRIYDQWGSDRFPELVNISRLVDAGYVEKVGKCSWKLTDKGLRIAESK